MNRDQAVGFGIGLLAGAAIGGVVALLFAPQSGEETRAMIKGKAEHLKERAQEVIGAFKHKEEVGAAK